MEWQVPVLECGSCHSLFKEGAVTVFRFFPDNQLCWQCCVRLYKAPVTVSCFGKVNTDKVHGYDSNTLSCSQLCPDRKVCPMFADESIFQYRELTESARKSALRFLQQQAPKKHTRVPKVIFRPDSNIGKAFMLCQRGCTMRELRKFCAESDTSFKWLIRILRKEIVHGHEWQWIETPEKLQAIYPKR
jgi:hypothetical protein